MTTDASDRRLARERDARRAGLFVLLANATLLASGDERRSLAWLGLGFVAVGIYYAIKSTFRLKSEDEPGYER